MTMDFRFFKADPEPTANVQWPAIDPGTEPTFTLVALQRDADPDSNTHDGFDYFGAYGVGDDIDAWAAGQPVTAITKAELPNPVTFYPAPFNEA
jgi:hypothetical protein